MRAVRFARLRVRIDGVTCAGFGGSSSAAILPFRWCKAMLPGLNEHLDSQWLRDGYSKPSSTLSCIPLLCPSVRAPPGLEHCSLRATPSSCEKATQTEMPNDMDERGEMLAICKLKNDRVDAVGQLFPLLAQSRLQTMTLAKLAFNAMMADPDSDSRAVLLDIIVTSVAEAHGCTDRAAFDAALGEVFGEKFNPLWRSRLHNSVFQVLRVNDIPCFKKKNKTRSGKKTKNVGSASVTAVNSLAGEADGAGGTVDLQTPETLLWLGGPES